MRNSTNFAENPEHGELTRIERRRMLERRNLQSKLPPAWVGFNEEHPWSIEVKDAERILGSHIRNQY